jgi:hypothetical protein
LELEDVPRPSIDDVESRFRQLAHEKHPDKGGNAHEFNALVKAREEARRALGVAS